MYLQISFLLLIGAANCQRETFDENLLLRPFPDGKVGAHFEFVVKTRALDIFSRSQDHHYDLFPKALGQILAKYSVEEFHVSLTQGHWHHDLWGYSPSPAPLGAQIRVLFLPEAASEIESLWRGLANGLSGLICASLSAVDSTNTAQPKFSYKPEGLVASTSGRKVNGTTSSVSLSRFRYATLSREAVCTENLTPLIKTLPCGSQAGLAALFNSLHLFDVNYHSLGIHVTHVCSNGEHVCGRKAVAIELKRTLTVVFDPFRKGPGKGGSWSLKTLFGQSIGIGCPLANQSLVYIDLALNESVTPVPDPDPLPGTHWGVYDFTTGKDAMFDISVKWRGKKNVQSSLLQPPIRITSFVSGYGQEFGQLHVSITNEFDSVFPVVLLQLVPWYFRVFLHTLSISVSNETVHVETFDYIPAKDRVRMHSLEWALDLPAKSTIHISIEFQSAFLKWTEHPPDARHGFYIPPAMLLFTAPSRGMESLYAVPTTGRTRRVYVYTKPLLVALPTPDFSMPYNVICFVCTIVAIGFGTLHNLTTKRFVVESRNKKGFLGRLKDKFFTKAKTD